MRRGLLLVYMLLLLLPAIILALDICPIEKMPTEISIDHARHPRNIALGVTTNTIEVTTTLESVNRDTGERTALANREIVFEITLTDKFVSQTSSGLFTLSDTPSPFPVKTDADGTVSMIISTDRPMLETSMNPKKISYAITASFAPGTREPLLGSAKTVKYTPGSFPLISMEACFPLLLVFALLIGAMFASGQNPFGMLDFSRAAFRAPQMRHRPVKGVTVSPLKALGVEKLVKEKLMKPIVKNTIGIAGRILSGTGKGIQWAGKKIAGPESMKTQPIAMMKGAPPKMAVSGTAAGAKPAQAGIGAVAGRAARKGLGALVGGIGSIIGATGALTSGRAASIGGEKKTKKDLETEAKGKAAQMIKLTGKKEALEEKLNQLKTGKDKTGKEIMDEKGNPVKGSKALKGEIDRLVGQLATQKKEFQGAKGKEDVKAKADAIKATNAEIKKLSKELRGTMGAIQRTEGGIRKAELLTRMMAAKVTIEGKGKMTLDEARTLLQDGKITQAQFDAATVGTEARAARITALTEGLGTGALQKALDQLKTGKNEKGEAIKDEYGNPVKNVKTLEGELKGLRSLLAVQQKELRGAKGKKENIKEMAGAVKATEGKINEVTGRMRGLLTRIRGMENDIKEAERLTRMMAAKVTIEGKGKMTLDEARKLLQDGKITQDQFNGALKTASVKMTPLDIAEREAGLTGLTFARLGVALGLTEDAYKKEPSKSAMDLLREGFMEGIGGGIRIWSIAYQQVRGIPPSGTMTEEERKQVKALLERLLLPSEEKKGEDLEKVKVAMLASLGNLVGILGPGGPTVKVNGKEMSLNSAIHMLARNEVTLEKFEKALGAANIKIGSKNITAFETLVKLNAGEAGKATPLDRLITNGAPESDYVTLFQKTEGYSPKVAKLLAGAVWNGGQWLDDMHVDSGGITRDQRRDFGAAFGWNVNHVNEVMSNARLKENENTMVMVNGKDVTLRQAVGQVLNGNVSLSEFKAALNISKVENTGDILGKVRGADRKYESFLVNEKGIVSTGTNRAGLPILSDSEKANLAIWNTESRPSKIDYMAWQAASAENDRQNSINNISLFAEPNAFEKAIQGDEKGAIKALDKLRNDPLAMGIVLKEISSRGIPQLRETAEQITIKDLTAELSNAKGNESELKRIKEKLGGLGLPTERAIDISDLRGSTKAMDIARSNFDVLIKGEMLRDKIVGSIVAPNFEGMMESDPRFGKMVHKREDAAVKADAESLAAEKRASPTKLSPIESLAAEKMGHDRSLTYDMAVLLATGEREETIRSQTRTQVMGEIITNISSTVATEQKALNDVQQRLAETNPRAVGYESLKKTEEEIQGKISAIKSGAKPFMDEIKQVDTLIGISKTYDPEMFKVRTLYDNAVFEGAVDATAAEKTARELSHATNGMPVETAETEIGRQLKELRTRVDGINAKSGSTQPAVYDTETGKITTVERRDMENLEKEGKIETIDGIRAEIERLKKQQRTIDKAKEEFNYFQNGVSDLARAFRTPVPSDPSYPIIDYAQNASKQLDLTVPATAPAVVNAVLAYSAIEPELAKDARKRLNDRIEDNAAKFEDMFWYGTVKPEEMKVFKVKAEEPKPNVFKINVTQPEPEKPNVSKPPPLISPTPKEPKPPIAPEPARPENKPPEKFEIDTTFRPIARPEYKVEQTGGSGGTFKPSEAEAPKAKIEGPTVTEKAKEVVESYKEDVSTIWEWAKSKVKKEEKK